MKCLLLLVIVTCVTVLTSKHPLHIFVVLSISEAQELESSNTSVMNYWKQTEKLLPAAELAANEVNNCSDVLNINYMVELLPIFVPDSDPNHGVVEFVKELVSERKNLVGVIGIFDNRFAKVILPLAGHVGIDLIQLVDPTALNLDNSRLYPHTFTIYPSLAVHLRAASFMFWKLNWNQVGLVYSSTCYDYLYLRAAESFLSFIKLIDIHINVVLIDIDLNNTANSTVDRLQQSGMLAFLTLLPQQVSTELMCAAQQQGLEYAWAIVDKGELDANSNNTLIYRCVINNASCTNHSTNSSHI